MSAGGASAAGVRLASVRHGRSIRSINPTCTCLLHVRSILSWWVIVWGVDLRKGANAVGGLSVLVMVPTLAAAVAQPNRTTERFFATVLRVGPTKGGVVILPGGIHTTTKPGQEIVVRVELLGRDQEAGGTFTKPGKIVSIPVPDARKVFSKGRRSRGASKSPIGRTYYFSCTFRGAGRGKPCLKYWLPA